VSSFPLCLLFSLTNLLMVRKVCILEKLLQRHKAEKHEGWNFGDMVDEHAAQAAIMSLMRLSLRPLQLYILAPWQILASDCYGLVIKTLSFSGCVV
jgi:hypothetical protein